MATAVGKRKATRRREGSCCTCRRERAADGRGQDQASRKAERQAGKSFVLYPKLGGGFVTVPEKKENPPPEGGGEAPPILDIILRAYEALDNTSLTRVRTMATLTRETIRILALFFLFSRALRPADSAAAGRPAASAPPQAAPPTRS